MVEGGGQLPQPDVWGSVIGLLELDVGGSDVELLYYLQLPSPVSCSLA